MTARLALALLGSNSLATTQTDLETRLLEKLRETAQELRLEGDALSGPGADALVAEGRAARFFLIGESHGNRETPALTRALLARLREHGYGAYAIETGPCATRIAESVARDKGADGVAQLLREVPFSIAFFNWRDEIDAFAAALAGGYRVWGLDQEFVGAPRLLLRELIALAPDDEARALAKSWYERALAGFAVFAETNRRNEAFFSVVTEADFDEIALAFAEAPEEAQVVVYELHQSWIVYRHYHEKRYYLNNRDRIRLMKGHLVDRLDSAGDAKVLFRFGSAHMGRGRSPFDQLDLGNLAAELAFASGSDSFHLYVLARQSVQRDGSTKSFAESSPYLRPLMETADPEHGVLFDLRALRPLLSSQQARESAREARDLAFRFDAALVLPAFHPATEVVPMPEGR